MWFIRRLFKEPNIYDIQFCGLYDRKKYLGVFTRKELRRELVKLQEIIDEVPIEMQREIEKKLIAKNLGIPVEQLDEEMMEIYEVNTFFVGSEEAFFLMPLHYLQKMY